MFARKNRISSTLFKRIFATGKKAFSGHFRLQYAPSETLRVAVVVPKKISKKRVQRNIYKRIILAELRELLSHTPPYAIIVWLQKDIGQLSRADTRTELSMLLSKYLKNQDKK